MKSKAMAFLNFAIVAIVIAAGVMWLNGSSAAALPSFSMPSFGGGDSYEAELWETKEYSRKIAAKVREWYANAPGLEEWTGKDVHCSSRLCRKID